MNWASLHKKTPPGAAPPAQNPLGYYFFVRERLIFLKMRPSHPRYPRHLHVKEWVTLLLGLTLTPLTLYCKFTNFNSVPPPWSWVHFWAHALSRRENEKSALLRNINNTGLGVKCKIGFCHSKAKLPIAPLTFSMWCSFDLIEWNMQNYGHWQSLTTWSLNPPFCTCHLTPKPAGSFWGCFEKWHAQLIFITKQSRSFWS